MVESREQRSVAPQEETMKWHLEVLRPAQQRLLGEAGMMLDRAGFYLAGGTAVALHIGHRRSIDLDWFSGESLGDVMRMAKALSEDIGFHTSEVAPGTLHGTASGVRLSFMEYRYPLLRRLASIGRFGCRVASLRDLACMKLSAAAQRGSKKDFVDIYALLTEHGTLAAMLDSYVRKYRVSDVSHVLYGLAYFEDAEKERMPAMLWNVTWKEVKDTVRGAVKEAARDLS